MSKRIIIFLLTVFTICIKAQISELISLQNMNIEDVNAYLEKNNWKFEKISGEEPPKLGILQYKLLSETDSNLVIARLFLYYKGNSIKRLTNIFINTGIYYNYLNDLEKINAKQIDDNSNSLKKVYQNKSHTFIFNFSKEKGDNIMIPHKYYILSLLSNEDYKNLKNNNSTN